MTFWDFAAGFPWIAVLFAAMAFALPVVLVALFVSWRVSRPVKYTAEDRKTIAEVATFVRLLCATNRLNAAQALEYAEKLERMAGR